MGPKIHDDKIQFMVACSKTGYRLDCSKLSEFATAMQVYNFFSPASVKYCTVYFGKVHVLPKACSRIFHLVCTANTPPKIQCALLLLLLGQFVVA
jgi:hypothetical protein